MESRQDEAVTQNETSAPVDDRGAPPVLPPRPAQRSSSEAISTLGKTPFDEEPQSKAPSPVADVATVTSAPASPAQPEWRKAVRADSMRNIDRVSSFSRGTSVAVPAQDEDSEISDYTMKIVLLGDSGVGKTSLWRCYTKGIRIKDMDEQERALQKATIGTDFLQRFVLIGQYRVKVMIWDTAGQERFESITRSYVRGAHGLVLVYDVTRPETRTRIMHWYKTVGMQAFGFGSGAVQPLVMVIGNKVDDMEHRKVDRQESAEMFRKEEFFYNETSAWDATNVQDAFDYFAGACWVQCVHSSAWTRRMEGKPLEGKPLEGKPLAIPPTQLIGGGGKTPAENNNASKRYITPQMPLGEQIEAARLVLQRSDSAKEDMRKLLASKGAAQYGTGSDNQRTASASSLSSRKQAQLDLGLSVKRDSSSEHFGSDGEIIVNPKCNC